MRIVVIAGFLGSGKTSLLVELARRAVGRDGLRVAIIENEVGKVGIDGDTIAAEGFAVRELFSGCVCCTLRLDLVNTLLELERGTAPDLVFMEPSGVAGPDQVVEALAGYGGETDAMALVVLLDSNRRNLIARTPPLPLVERGVKAANLILVSKTDIASPEDIAALSAWASRLNPDAALIPVSTKTGDNLDVAAEAITEILRSSQNKGLEEAAIEPRGQTDMAGEAPAVFSEKRSYQLARPVPAQELERSLAALLSSIAGDAVASSGELAGHVKASVRDEGGVGYLAMSVTKLGEPHSVKGRLRSEVEKFSLTLNAIAYGADHLRLSMSTRRRLAEFMSEG